jgi:Skp family chaperone for outer membrane proteins
MSTQALSSSSIYQELQTFYQTRQSDLQALGSALQSGDLQAAQQEYSQLVSLGQSGPFGSTQPFRRSDRASDFAAIGKALSSGDLAGAQTAFAKLQQTFGQSSSSSAQSSPAYTVNLSAASTPGTSGTSGTESIYQQLQDFRSARKTDLQQLGQALSSGDLTTAEQDYQNLVTLGQQGPFASGGPFRRFDRAQDFQAIGQALQAGNATSAQQAYAALESTFGRQRGSGTPGDGSHIHVGSGGHTNSGAGGVSEIVINIGGTGSSTPQSSSGSELVVNLPAPTSTGSPEEVQINFGGTSGSSGQLTVEVGQTQDKSGNTGEQVTINLMQANNRENIVLNLFGAGSSTQSQTQGSSLNVQG